MTDGVETDPTERVFAQSDFTLKKALFEIAIVAIGVLLALAVDEARQSSSDHERAEEARAGMRTEIEQNRIRLATKISLLHNAYIALEANPAAGPSLVGKGGNFQITLTDVAWTMAVETGALRLLKPGERQALAYVYNSHSIYNELLADEMRHWTALTTVDGNGPELKIWKAYARRVSVGACISTIRIERFLRPDLPAEPLRRACQQYRPSIRPEDLYRQMGIPMPNANWRPGGEF